MKKLSIALLLTLGLACRTPAPTDSGAQQPADLPALSDTAPEVGPASPISVPAPTEAQLDNGLRLMVHEQNTLPLIELALIVPGGSFHDPPERRGQAWLATEMLSRGAGERGALELAAALEQRAIQLGTRVEGNHRLIRFTLLAEHLPFTIELLADLVLRPRFEPDDLERLRNEQRVATELALDDPGTVVGWGSEMAWYGPEDPRAWPRAGTVPGRAATTSDHLRADHEATFQPGGATLIAAGATTAAELEALLITHLGAWSDDAGPRALVELPMPAGPEAPLIRLVQREGASQTALRARGAGPSLSDEGALAERLASVILGGTFTSRLNSLMREERGYTYGAWARLASGTRTGSLRFGSNVQADQTLLAVRDMMGTVETLGSDGVDAREVALAQATMRTGVVEQIASLGGLLSVTLDAVREGRGHDYLDLELAAAAELDEAQVDAAAARLVSRPRVLTAVGDASLLDGLSEDGYRIEPLDLDSLILGE